MSYTNLKVLTGILIATTVFGVFGWYGTNSRLNESNEELAAVTAELEEAEEQIQYAYDCIDRSWTAFLDLDQSISTDGDGLALFTEAYDSFAAFEQDCAPVDLKQ